jgi:hypothetical protein
MYVARRGLTEARQLEQGDLVRGLFRPRVPTRTNILKLQAPRNFASSKPAQSNDLLGNLELLRGVNLIERLDLALVISNSCDTDGGDQILFAAVRPYKFEDWVGDDPAEQWRMISESATGTASPKLFYLPRAEPYAIARSEAVLKDLVLLEQSYVDLCIANGASIACGLDPSSILHLQWHLAAAFGRNPRDDDAWPSDEDRRLKIEWLDRELKNGSPRHARHVEEKRRLEERLRQVAEQVATDNETESG